MLAAAAAGHGRACSDGEERGGEGEAAVRPARRAVGTGSRGSRARSASRRCVLLSIVFSPIRGGRPVFLDIGNLTDILRQVAEKGILAVGHDGGRHLGRHRPVGRLRPRARRDADGVAPHEGGVGLRPAALAVLGVGAAWGAVNGFVVARWRLQPFIATLATMSAARGVARYLSGGTAIPLGFGPGGAPESVRAIAGDAAALRPVPAVIFVSDGRSRCTSSSRGRAAGRYVYAIGDNEAAARLSGIRVGWHKASVYVIAAMLAALAGLVHCAQLEQGNPNDGVAYELDAIAAVVIGGTSLSGGSRIGRRYARRRPDHRSHQQHHGVEQCGCEPAAHPQGRHHPRRRLAPAPAPLGSHRTMRSEGRRCSAALASPGARPAPTTV